MDRDRDVHAHPQGGRAFYAPVLCIAALIGSYLLIIGWETVPHLVSSALALVH